jgi:hypothetical protein
MFQNLSDCTDFLVIKFQKNAILNNLLAVFTQGCNLKVEDNSAMQQKIVAMRIFMLGKSRRPEVRHDGVRAAISSLGRIDSGNRYIRQIRLHAIQPERLHDGHSTIS